MQACFLYTSIDIPDRVLIAGDNVKVGTKFHSAVSNWAGDVLEIIDGKFLGYHINNLITRRNIGFILIRDQLINLGLRNLFFSILSYYVSSCLQAFNMVACNANIDFIYFQVRIGCVTILKRSFNGFDCFIDVKHLPMLNTVTVGTAKSKNLQFTEFIFSSGYYGDLGCTNVKADNNGLFVVHSMLFLVVCIGVMVVVITKREAKLLSRAANPIFFLYPLRSFILRPNVLSSFGTPVQQRSISLVIPRCHHSFWLLRLRILIFSLCYRHGDGCIFLHLPGFLQ